MAFQWQSKAANVQSGVEDMVLLSRVTDGQIVDNLHKRYNSDLIYTYIGPVLIALNPYKKLSYFTEREIDMYHGATAHENPPHIYALAEGMFQHMLTDEENQCVIISGESGAGKTESSKLLMNYVAAVSGKGGSGVDHVKQIILGSNPLLESFGNAKTLRNNNSSRFGKYFEIKFSRGGQPVGGNISNFLLEKSRVVAIKEGERNFHIFYQMTKGCNAQEREWYGMAAPDYFHYLNQSSAVSADGVDDIAEFQDVKKSMGVCGISAEDQACIFQIVAGILHLGNVSFVESGANAVIGDESVLSYPAYLLGMDQNTLKEKLLSRLVATGGAGSRRSFYNVPLNVLQANNTRDALAKALYSRVFDWIISAVNKAIYKADSGNDKLLSLGVLDIYGFEIFDKNGFEQLCINYVNEKLQQVFIELTLKSEQEEYVREGIKWTPIQFFNNKVVVELIEEKRPAGVMAILDDVCIQLHAQSDGADTRFVEKLQGAVGSHPHFSGGNNRFVIKHYAGSVSYDADGFCDANKDTLFRDLILLAQSTSIPFIKALFPEDVAADDKKRPTTSGFKIRNQCNDLVGTLMKCTPSYIRCIKPNEKKRPKEWEAARVEHQVRYLNLRENINVRRAGFCYRNTFDKFIRRFGVLTPQTFPAWHGSPSDGVSHLMNAANMDPNQWQLGRSKVFIKAPESLFMLEEMRERIYHDYAKKIQRAWRRYRARKYYLECKKQSMSVFVGRKERRRFTLNRDYLGDYISYLDNPLLRSLVGKQEKVLFCDEVKKYDRRFKPKSIDLFVTENAIVMIALEKITQGPNKGKFEKVVKRRLVLNQINGITLSSKCDDFFVVHVPSEFDNVLECIFKSELVSVLVDVYLRKYNQRLPVVFSDSIQYTVKKTRWESAGSRMINFISDPTKTTVTVVQTNSKGTDVAVPPGLPKDSQPSLESRQIAKGQQKTNASKWQGNAYPQSTQAPRGPPNSNYAPPSQLPYGAPPQQPYGLPPQQFSAGRAPQNHQLGGSAQTRFGSQDNLGASRNPGQSVHASNSSINGQPKNTLGGQFSSSNNDLSSQSRGGYTQGSANNLARSNPSLNTSNPSLANSARGKAPAPAPPKPKVDQCRALYDYRAQEADELSISPGDVITIISKDSEGWWTGVCKGKKGLFPANYVEKI